MSVQVVAGVIRNAKGDYLLSQRQLHQEHALDWEFPGGKVERGESLLQALQRELYEEVGLHIDCSQAQAITSEQWDYGNKRVHIHFFLVTTFTGEPQGREGQIVRWYSTDQLVDMPMPAANTVVIDMLWRQHSNAQ